MTRQVTPTDRVLVVIPVYGHHDMTHALIGDLLRERSLADIVVVDNSGDYRPLGGEDVLRPGSNLGWAGGTNFGTVQRREREHVGFIWLNNDTRLSDGFVDGLLRSWRSSDAGIVAPLYDCHWLHQRPRHTPTVDEYEPKPTSRKAPFVDGTCMFVPATTVDAIGLLDEETFAPIGWGADIDYCLRAREAGLDVRITGLAYLHHEKSVTGKTVYAGGLQEYATRGYPVLVEGLRLKWGEDWQARAGIDPTTGQTAPAGWRNQVRQMLRRARR